MNNPALEKIRIATLSILRRHYPMVSMAASPQFVQFNVFDGDTNLTVKLSEEVDAEVPDEGAPATVDPDTAINQMKNDGSYQRREIDRAHAEEVRQGLHD